MRYLQVDIDPSPAGPSPWLGKILQKVFPAANPDIEQYFSHARRWWIEINDNGEPIREIGFDSENNPIVLGPVGRNYGFLVDSPVDWLNSDLDSAEAAQNFETIWRSLWGKFSHLDT